MHNKIVIVGARSPGGYGPPTTFVVRPNSKCASTKKLSKRVKAHENRKQLPRHDLRIVTHLDPAAPLVWDFLVAVKGLPPDEENSAQVPRFSTRIAEQLSSEPLLSAKPILLRTLVSENVLPP